MIGIDHQESNQNKEQEKDCAEFVHQVFKFLFGSRQVFFSQPVIFIRQADPFCRCFFNQGRGVKKDHKEQDFKS